MPVLLVLSQILLESHGRLPTIAKSFSINAIICFIKKLSQFHEAGPKAIGTARADTTVSCGVGHGLNGFPARRPPPRETAIRDYQPNAPRVTSLVRGLLPKIA